MERVAKGRMKFGKYEVKFHPGGGFTFYGQGIRQKGNYVPPDNSIRELSEASGRKFSSYLDTVIGYRGIIVEREIKGVVVSGIRSVRLGREALGIQGPTIITKDGRHVSFRISQEEMRQEIAVAIKKFWPVEEIREYRAGKRGVFEHKGLTIFRETFSREHHAACKRLRGLKKIMEWIGGDYIGLYPFVNRRQNKAACVREEQSQLREEILRRYYSGLHISETALLQSPIPEERELYRKLKLSAEDLFGRKKGNYSGFVSKLTGLKRADIALTCPAVKQNSFLGEKIIEFFFNWAFLVDLDLGGIVPKGEVYGEEKMKKFNYDDYTRRGIADLRIGNQAIEVKTLTGEFKGKKLEDLLQKYSSGRSVWLTGERLNATVIFNAGRKFYENAIPKIEAAGIKIISYEEIHDAMLGLIEVMKSDYSRKIGEVRPRIHSLEYLDSLHEEVSLAPHLLSRPGNILRSGWSIGVLYSLIKKAQEVRNAA